MKWSPLKNMLTRAKCIPYLNEPGDFCHQKLDVAGMDEDSVQVDQEGPQKHQERSDRGEIERLQHGSDSSAGG
jgi:hypothetical protein